MVMLFLVFLKIDVTEILHHLKQFKLLFYIVVTFLFLTPIAIYLIVSLFNQELALGLLLLTSMPAGAATPALTDMFKGNAALAMVIVVLTSMIAPFSIPIIFSFLDFQDIKIDQLEMFKTLLLMIIVPMLLSQVFKKYFPQKVDKLKPTFSAINVLIMTFILYTVIGVQRDMIFANFSEIIISLVAVYLVFIALHILGYLLAFKLPYKDKITFVITKTYVNNALAIVIAAKFFTPTITLLMVLSELPWATLLVPLKKVLNYFEIKNKLSNSNSP